jgi:hypothetical protein
MAETANSNHNINNVEALWPRLNQTYRYDSTEKRTVPCDALDDGSEYALRFRMDLTQAKALYKEMRAAYQSARKSEWPEKFERPFKEEDDGSFTHKAKLKGAYGNDTTRAPAQYDAKSKKLPEDFLLTTGSTVNIAVSFTPYSGAMGAGVSLRLKAVQVIDLKPMIQPESPFSAVDGFDFNAGEEDNPFAESEDAPVEEPKKKVAKKAPPAPEQGSGDLGSIVDDWDD